MFSRRITFLRVENMNGILGNGFGIDFSSFPLGELSEFQNRNRFICEARRLRKTIPRYLYSNQFLSSVKSFIPEKLISYQNFKEMEMLASNFPGGVTSFFGFESHLNSPKARADYLFAVSSRGGEREALAALIKNGSLPDIFIDDPNWRIISNFILEWANPKSNLYNNVLGLWLEFDMAEKSSEIPIPCIFLHTHPLRMTFKEEKKELLWLTETAFPLLTGKTVTNHMKTKIFQTIQQLPKDAFIMDAGVMLSRKTPGVRLIVTRISPQDILPYLTKIGWSEKDEQLQHLLTELDEQVSRIVLHITVTENGIEQKIGLECSFSPDRYHLEDRWSSFFNYLIKKGLCLPRKKNALLQFMGVELENPNKEFTTDLYKPSVKIHPNKFSSALVRFISHVKLVYEPNHILLAKAYSGVRLLGCPHNSSC